MSTLRHDNVRNITAELSKEVCHDVKVELQLQQLTGEDVVFFLLKIIYFESTY